MISAWGVDHGSEVSKGLRDYIHARKATHSRSIEDRKANSPKWGFKEAADLEGLKKTFTSRSYRKGQTAMLRDEYQQAKTSRKKK